MSGGSSNVSNDQHDLEKRVHRIIQNIKVDGLPNIIRSYLVFFKFLWFGVLVVSSTFCSYLIVYSFLDYFKFEVNTSFRMITEIKSTYPTITFCNMNPMNTEYYIKWLEEANLISTTTWNTVPYENFLHLERYVKNKRGSYFTRAEKELMSDLDGELISCSYSGNPCNSSYFRYFFHPYYLNCFQFNSGFNDAGEEVAKLQASLAGFDNSLIFEFYTGLPNTLAAKTTKRGYYVFVSNTTEFPFNKAPVPLSVSPGFALRVGTFRHFYNQFNEWPFIYSECTIGEENKKIKPLADTSLFDKVTKYEEYAYSRDTCVLFCYQQLTAERCNCTNYWIDYHPDGDYDYCYGESKTCADTFYTHTFNTGSFIADHCIAKCPLECHKTVFKNYQAFYAYPDALYVNSTLQTNTVLIEKYSNETDFTVNLASNAVSFVLFYDLLSYINVEEEAKITWEILMGQLGGHLHLFLGMSLISLVELFELVVNLLLLSYFRARKNKKWAAIPNKMKCCC